MDSAEEEHKENVPTTSQTSETSEPSGSPVSSAVSWPKVVLTRIDGVDINTLVKASPKKKPVKRLGATPKKVDASKSPSQVETPSLKNENSRGRNRPRQDYKLLADMMPKPKAKAGPKSVVKKNTTTPERPYSGSAKDLLKKTTIQKRSKIIIPTPKKSKPTPKKTSKPVKSSPIPTKSNKNTSTKSSKITLNSSKSKGSVKTSPPKPKLPILSNKIPDSDSSGDEFLYEELIEEIGNTKKGIVGVRPATESPKTTNITLKPSAGNKPPTIVKGGIVKRTDLPPDLKSIASPIKTPASAGKRNYPLVLSPVPAKKPSPWSGSESPSSSPITPQKKASLKNKIEDKVVKANEVILPTKEVQKKIIVRSPITIGRPKIGPKQTAKVVPLAKPSQDGYMSDEYTEMETLEEAEHLVVKENLTKPAQEIKTNSVNPTPRSTPTVVEDVENDLLKIFSEDTEVSQPEKSDQIKNSNTEATKETLTENTTSSEDIAQASVIDTNLPSTSADQTSAVESVAPSSSEDITENTPEETKLDEAETQNTEPVDQNMSVDDSVTTTAESNLPTDTNSTDDDNTDLKTTTETNITNSGAGDIQPISDDIVNPTSLLSKSQTDLDNKSSIKNTENKKTTVVETKSKKEQKAEEEPQVRTVYDLINEISLKYPSWNLHIIPETNAFCIAQVTKGRLGLPTLKKCIELDAETYFAKVYIHQYHIKRFDGVYDNETDILALVEEIHSIKA